MFHVSPQWGIKKELPGDGEGCLVGKTPITLESRSTSPPDVINPAPPSTFTEVGAALISGKGGQGPRCWASWKTEVARLGGGR